MAGEGAPRPLSGPRVPALAPGCRVHVLSEDEALITGTEPHVALRGHAHALVAPLIDGRTSEEEIVAALAHELPAAIVRLVLTRLAARDLIVYVAPRTPPQRSRVHPPPDGIVGSLELPAPGELRWIGIGTDDTVISRLRASITAGARGLPAGARGLPAGARGASAGARGARRGLTVALLDDYLRPELHGLAVRCQQHDSALLPIRISATEWWFGPYCDGAAAVPMWRLFRHRLGEHRRADLQALERGATFPLYDEPAGETDEDEIAYASNLIAAAARGEPTEPILDGLIVRDRREGGLTEHPISAAAPTGPMLKRVAPLISPITGVIAGLERVPALEGTHVYATAGTLDWPDRAGGGSRPVFRHGALGKGLTDAQARASCVGEALELASTRFTGEEPRRRARWDQIAELAIHPRELLLVSDDQYARAQAHAAPPSWDGIPPRFDERHAIEWVPSMSLTNGETRWLPAAYCYFGYEDPEHHGPMFATANANGCAVGVSREEAILQGLLELIERDACALWWYSRAARPAIDLDSIGNARLSSVREANAALGRELALLDLRADTEVTVVAAVAWARERGTLLPIGRGCHLDPARAVEHALAELSQVAAVASPTEAPPATVGQRPNLLPLSSAPVSVDELPNLATSATGEGIDWCVRMLARIGHEVLVLDTTRLDIGLPAVRVVVPGLRPLLPRLAPGRLYDVPFELGWVAQPLLEAELNPDPFIT